MPYMALFQIQVFDGDKPITPSIGTEFDHVEEVLSRASDIAAAVRASGIVDQCKAAGRLTILDADGNLVEELKIS
jgi:hypothetical protein